MKLKQEAVENERTQRTLRISQRQKAKKITVGEVLDVIGEVDRPVEAEILEKVREGFLDWEIYKMQVVNDYRINAQDKKELKKIHK